MNKKQRKATLYKTSRISMYLSGKTRNYFL